MKQQIKRRIWLWYLTGILTLTSLNLGILTIAQYPARADVVRISQATSVPGTSTTTAAARDIFRQAYENRYTWRQQFPGYTAVVEFKQGQKNYRGQIRLTPDLKVEVTGIKNEEARQAVANLLSMIAIHRRSVPFDVAHKNSTFQLGTTDQHGAVEIFEKQGTTDSHYKVQQQQITQVNRLLGKTAVTVNLLDSKVTTEGYLATRYRTTFRQPQTGQVVGEQEAEETYQKIGNYYLLTHQVTHDFEQDQETVTQIDFTNIQLLSGH